MRRKTGRARRGEAGIGIVELMIALTLTTLLLTAIYGTFFRTRRAADQVMGKVEWRQGARAAVQLIERDLRMAGSGWGRMQVNGVYNSAALTLRGINPGYGGTAGNDSITALGGWDVSTTLRSAMSSQTAAIPCNSTTGFVNGDLAVVTNGSSAHLFQVTGVSTSPADLTHGSSSLYNVGTLAGWPAGGYATGTRVFKAGWVTYRHDATTFARPSLVRQAFGKTPALIAFDIESFRIWYRMDDGTETRNPVNLPMIEQVAPVLRTSNASGSPQLADSIWAAIRPRTF